MSTLTICHTDLYLRRAFSTLQAILDPDTVFFLGDLFDGGREWATGNVQEQDQQWKGYDKGYWLREYGRFGHVFLDTWVNKKPKKSLLGPQRKLVASLPGNHDLGIGNDIHLAVRDRFQTFFGYGNRVDVVANHTFVSVDSVSLTAKEQPGREAQEHGEGETANKAIWGPTEDFLSRITSIKVNAVNRELRIMAGKSENFPLDHAVMDIDDPAIRTVKTSPKGSIELPTILLTHVPLYRDEGTPCGPLRERWPPSKPADDSNDTLEKDPRNAISVTAGYQYQNVLTPTRSNELIEKIGNVEHVFSGDDHDYCEVVHHRYTSRGGGIREITVKSISWAMGVRKPGFLMLSLWNPINGSGYPINLSRGELGQSSHSAEATTLQTHLCLLPDQLSIFIRYGLLFVLTIFSIIVRASVRQWRLPRASAAKGPDNTVLPIFQSYSVDNEALWRDAERLHPSASAYTASELHSSNGLAVRSTASRGRSASPSDGYALPIMHAEKDDEKAPLNGKRGNAHDWNGTPRREDWLKRGVTIVWRETKDGIMIITSVALTWYTWLVWTS